jgi:hypothetical protein
LELVRDVGFACGHERRLRRRTAHVERDHIDVAVIGTGDLRRDDPGSRS